MRVSDFSMLWTPKLDSVGSSYNGQLSCLHWASLIALTLSTRQGRLRRIPSLGFLPIFTRCSHPTPPTYGPGLHPSGEERPLSWSLLQLWQTRPHHEGLLRTMCPECLERQCYNDSETCS